MDFLDVCAYNVGIIKGALHPVAGIFCFRPAVFTVRDSRKNTSATSVTPLHHQFALLLIGGSASLHTLNLAEV